MGNCCNKKTIFNPGVVLDRVIAGASAEDDCPLYRLANFKKGGLLIEAFTKGGSKAVEKMIKTQLSGFMYNKGRGELITRTEYLRWKYRNNKKEKINIDERAKTRYDPLHVWEDHTACWQMQYRGSLGESLLHILIICDSPIHTRIARLLLKYYPVAGFDMIEGEEYLGATGLHLAIAYGNDEVAEMLILNCKVPVSVRARGVFFLPTDQQSDRPVVNTTYHGLAYMGEYPLTWSAFLCNEGIYNLLLDRGADPDAQDTYGNTVLHMVVVAAQLGMYGYALRHPRKNANPYIKNNRGLTCLTLSCELGRDEIFKSMLELSCTEFWRYSNITCCGYPLGALDSIQPDGQTNWSSALIIILNGTKPQHLNMLEGGIIAKLLEEKWTTFAKMTFYKKMVYLIIHLICISGAVYARPDFEEPLMRGLQPGTEMDNQDIMRYCFEASTILSTLAFMCVQLGEEIKNAGVGSFLKNLKSSPPKILYVVSNILMLSCIPLRFLQTLQDPEDPEMCGIRTIEGEEEGEEEEQEVTCALQYRIVEESMLVFAVPMAWFYLMFFAGAIKLTGPFVTMIFSMITGDMFTFSIIYIIFLFGFTQSFHFIMKTTEAEGYDQYMTTWISLFHMTLGEYEYDDLNDSPYPGMAKMVFVIFQILIPILLLNMLIAMMGNTYAIVISTADKEFLKQWAKVIMSIERSYPTSANKEFLESYSIKLSETERGVMVIKSKDKTRASQRKGALSNWKKTGKTVVKYLKKRGISGDDLRREMWVHDEAETPKANRKKKGKGYDISFALGEVQPKVTLDNFGGDLLGGLTKSKGMTQAGVMQPGMMPPMGGSNMDLMNLAAGSGTMMDPSMAGMAPMPNHCCTHGAMHCTMATDPVTGMLTPAMDPMSGMMTSTLPPIDQHQAGGLSPGLYDLTAMRTPHGGIKTKKTKQQKREELYNKKRSRKSVSKQLMSLDFGFLGPPDSESSEDDMFTVPASRSSQQHAEQAQIKYQRMTSPTKRQLHQVSTERETISDDDDDEKTFLMLRGADNKGFVASESDPATTTALPPAPATTVTVTDESAKADAPKEEAKEETTDKKEE